MTRRHCHAAISVTPFFRSGSYESSMIPGCIGPMAAHCWHVCMFAWPCLTLSEEVTNIFAFIQSHFKPIFRWMECATKNAWPNKGYKTAIRTIKGWYWRQRIFVKIPGMALQNCLGLIPAAARWTNSMQRRHWESAKAAVPRKICLRVFE